MLLRSLERRNTQGDDEPEDLFPLFGARGLARKITRRRARREARRSVRRRARTSLRHWLRSHWVSLLQREIAAAEYSKREKGVGVNEHRNSSLSLSLSSLSLSASPLSHSTAPTLPSTPHLCVSTDCGAATGRRRRPVTHRFSGSSTSIFTAWWGLLFCFFVCLFLSQNSGNRTITRPAVLF